MKSTITKLVVAVIGAVAVAAQSYVGGADGIQWAEAIQVAIAGFAAADVWLTANVPSARTAKALVMAGASILSGLAAHYATGGNLADVHWWNVGLMALTTVGVYLAKNEPEGTATR